MTTIHKEIEIERNKAFVWIADLIVSETVNEMIQLGLNTMKQTLESNPA